MALNYQPGGLRAIIVIQALLTIWRHFRSAQSKWRLTGFRRAFRLLALSGLQHEELHVELVDLPAPAEFGDPLSPWRRVRDLPVAQATDCWHAEYRALPQLTRNCPKRLCKRKTTSSILPRRNAELNAGDPPGAHARKTNRAAASSLYS